jgi:cold shock CspA family protein
MFEGTIISELGRGAFWCEQDTTHTSVFVHISQVSGRRVLHIGDRIQFSIADNPLRPGKSMAVNVDFIGRVIAVQRSTPVASGGRS